MGRHTGLRAIETEYRGYKFRSRLEARWAVFFDTLGLPWEYESQGYRLADGTPYLPDFWLPTLNTWYEVKPPITIHNRHQIEETKAWRFMNEIAAMQDPNLHSAIAFGNIPSHTLAVIHREDSVEAFRAHGFTIYRNGDSPHGWVICQHCGKIGITYDARNSYNCEHAEGKEWTPHHRSLIAAYQAARSARFEHGENPRRQRFQFGKLE